jgi:ligand-binding sensor domain-containing protein
MKKLLILSLIFLSLPSSVLADGSSSAYVPTDKILIGDTVKTPDGTLWFIDQDGKAPYPSEVVFNTYRFNSVANIKKVTEKQLKTFSSPALLPCFGK